MTQAHNHNANYHVVAVGNAIVDVVAHEPDSFLTKHGLAKGGMTLVDYATIDKIYASMNPAIQQSGGSAANTIAGLASLGAKCGFMGRVAHDQFGKIFTHDLQALGVVFNNSAHADTEPTARCLVAVSPDAQRTMATYLGVSTELTVADLDLELIKQAQITYLEGYLFDKPAAKLAFQQAASVARQAGRMVALTLSDTFCVDRHRLEFWDLLNQGIDILFANEAEACAMVETDNVDHAAAKLMAVCPTVIITLGAKGAMVCQRDNLGEELVVVPAAKATEVLDTTGAGDLFAAGFLYGYTHGFSAAESAALGARCAAQIISHLGARPEQSLQPLLKAA
jgi:sugar/nucleoside kinase (ribokinase family)